MLSHVITQIVDAITRAYLDKSTNVNIDEDPQGDYTIRMHKFYNILGWSCAVIAVVPLVAMIFDMPDLLTLLVLVPFYLLMFGFFAALGILTYRNHQVVFNHTYIVVTTPLGKVKTATWKSIVEVRFNSTTGFAKLTDQNGQKLRVNQHLVGRNDLIRMLHRQTGIYFNFPD